MKTKVGDMVRVCCDSFSFGTVRDPAFINPYHFRVKRIVGDRIEIAILGGRLRVRSWVRVRKEEKQ